MSLVCREEMKRRDYERFDDELSKSTVGSLINLEPPIGGQWMHAARYSS